MKIKKHEFQEEIDESQKQPAEFIKKVIYPFTQQIQRMQMTVYIATTSTVHANIKMDWVKYQLILFNIIQNAVKYNKKKGYIIIELNCLPMAPLQEGRYMLETTVVDAGEGISEER